MPEYTEDNFRAVMTAKHDEGFAHVRDFIIRSGDDEIAKYAENLMDELDDDDVAVKLRAHLAMLGLFHAWLSVLEERDG